MAGHRVVFILAALLGAPSAAGFAFAVTENGYEPGGAPWSVSLVPAVSLLLLPALRWRRPLAPLPVGILVALAAAPPLLWEAGTRSGDLGQCAGCIGGPSRPRAWLEAMECHSGTDLREYPDGWLADSPLLATYPGEARLVVDHLRTAEARARWAAHSHLTGLWQVDRGPAALWYPGGPLRKGLAGVEYRSL